MTDQLQGFLRSLCQYPQPSCHASQHHGIATVGVQYVCFQWPAHPHETIPLCVSWRHPRSKRWHQLDLILVRRTAIKNVLHTRSYHSADCDTDHSLVCCKVRLHPTRFHRGKKQGNPRIDVTKMSQTDLVEQFAERFENELGISQSGDSATAKWTTLRDTMHRTALAMFGKTLRNRMTGSRPNLLR